MSAALHQWLGQRTQVAGVFAAAVKCADGTRTQRSYHEAFPESCFEQAWPLLGEALSHLNAQRLPAHVLLWTFEQGQIFCLQRPDGATLALLTEAQQHPAIEELMAEFMALGGVSD